MACRDLQKAARVAAEMQLEASKFSLMKLDLGSLQSVREFVKDFESKGLPLHALLNNAASYQLRLKAMSSALPPTTWAIFC
jgi:protochlorophyllide reductase